MYTLNYTPVITWNNWHAAAPMYAHVWLTLLARRSSAATPAVRRCKLALHTY